jgi:hypothetical protein
LFASCCQAAASLWLLLLVKMKDASQSWLLAIKSSKTHAD